MPRRVDHEVRLHLQAEGVFKHGLQLAAKAGKPVGPLRHAHARLDQRHAQQVGGFVQRVVADEFQAGQGLAALKPPKENRPGL
jgi:hypothetical protein